MHCVFKIKFKVKMKDNVLRILCIFPKSLPFSVEKMPFNFSLVQIFPKL